MSQHKVALVIGAGDATGGAIARRFAREGYTACVTRRNLNKLQPLLEQIRCAGGKAEGFASDARREEEVVALVEQIESTAGPIEVLVFNIGANVPASILEETARKYFKIWEMACLGGFLNGREVAKRMVAREGDGHKGMIIFTGATASLRGAANFAAFAVDARRDSGPDARAGAIQRLCRRDLPRDPGRPQKHERSANRCRRAAGGGVRDLALLAQASDQEVKERLKQVTQDAVARGVFGAPTFFVGGHMFWGQDRLEFVKEALK